MSFSLVAGDSVLPLTIANLMPSFEHPPLMIKQKVIERYGRDGGAITGDRRIASRKLKLEISVGGANEAAYAENAKNLYSIAASSNLYLYDDTLGYRLALSVGSITPKSEVYRRAEKWVLDCVAPDGAWETIDAEVYADEYDDEYEPGFHWQNGETISLNNTNPLDAWLVLDLESTNFISEFAIVNVTTGAVIRVGESEFTNGVRMVLDSRDGSAYLYIPGDDAVDVKQKIADNTGYIALAPGVNVLRYESVFGPVIANVSYRLRRPF